MNKIINIIPISSRNKSKELYKLILDDDSSYTIDDELIVKYNLKVDMEVDHDQLYKWIYEVQVKKAYNMALRYLSYSAKTIKEMKEYLFKKEFEQDIINVTIEKLCSYKFIDDKIYADSWVKNKRREKSIGKKRIAFELKNKGIDSDIIENILDNITEDAEIEQAIGLAQKHYSNLKNKSEKEMYNKVAQALYRKGYNWEVTKSAIDYVLKDSKD